jgi:type II secretory ATPase GspE/PulE/Tfp pilus assembly ATPase PilB-like protein
MNDDQILAILVKQNYVGEKDAEKAKKHAEKNHVSIVEYLISNELISRELLGQAIAESYGVQYADLAAKPPTAEELAMIPEEVARKFHLAVYKYSDTSITFATDDPTNPEMQAFMEKGFPNFEIKYAYTPKEDLNSLFVGYRKSLNTRVEDILKSGGRMAPELLSALIEDAVGLHASDIHFEPQEREVVVRFRIDGVLQEAGRLPKNIYENVLNRLKVQSQMRIDEHFAAQDGAMRFHTETVSVDMRVSIVPTLDGEKVVMRLLAEYVKGFTFADLGMTERNEQKLNDISKKPFGMLLITGPTGSGKSSTLYALLKSLNNPGVNITTIEDPVEYKIQGVNQIQVNTATKLTFASGLRTIVRQDPDIILVGEIRDFETAEIAVNAALTGHLLFSTFHANDAPTAIPRLIEMGIEPYLLASTLELIMSQRLVRKICESCRYSVKKKISDLETVVPGAKRYFDKEETLYAGKGCESCGGTGFRGRSAIYEYIEITQEMEELILKNPSTKDIWALARKQGSHSLFEDGIDKVKQGITTLEELLRVAAPPTLETAYGRKK